MPSGTSPLFDGFPPVMSSPAGYSLRARLIADHTSYPLSLHARVRVRVYVRA